MQTAFQENAFQTVQLAFQIAVGPVTTVTGPTELNLGGLPPLGQPDHSVLGG